MKYFIPMFYDIHELFIYFNQNKEKINKGQIKVFHKEKHIKKIEELFNREIIPESRPYYEFRVTYLGSVITFIDNSTLMIKDRCNISVNIIEQSDFTYNCLKCLMFKKNKIHP